MASSAPGFSRLERSPGSSPTAVGPDRAPHDLGAAGLGELVHEHDLRGRGTTSRGARPRRPELGRERVVGRRRPGSSTTKHQIASPFTSSGTPTAAASATRGMRRQRALDLRRAQPLAGDLHACRRCGRAGTRSPSSSTLAQSPCTHTSGHRAPVRVEVALGVASSAARHAGPRLRAHELADVAAAPAGPRRRTRRRPCRGRARRASSA